MSEHCENPISIDQLADYWAAALSPDEEDRVEAHLMSCDLCGARLRKIIAMGEAIRSLARKGELRVIISSEFLERAAKEGLRARQYAPPNHGSVECTVTSKDDLLISRLAADLSDAKRLDLVFAEPGGTHRMQDIPFNPEAREVIMSVSVPYVRSLPANVATMQLISVDESGEQVIGEYRFNHTPSED